MISVISVVMLSPLRNRHTHHCVKRSHLQTGSG